MNALLAGAAAGFLSLAVLPALPPPWLMPVLFPVLLVVAWRWRQPWWLALAAAALALGFASWRMEQQLAAQPAAAQEARSWRVAGRVEGLPLPASHGGWRIRFVVPPSADWPQGGRWQLHVRHSERPLPGAVCMLTARLKRPHGLANPGGFDYEAWLLSEGVTATGSARDLRCERVDGGGIDRLRLALRDHLAAQLSAHPEAGVLLALVTGDRALVPAATWERYAATGIIHLMAISGLHITLLAGVVVWLVRRLLGRFPALALRLPLQKNALLAGLLAAVGYGAVAGFSLPTQRTVLMLAVLVLMLWRERALPAGQVLLMALVAVLAWQPAAVHAAGFWLSFGAVGLLMLMAGAWRHLPGWRQAVAVQFGLSLLLLPMTVAFFERASWVSPFANLLAVPLVTFLVVPLGLLGLMLWGIAPAWADACWLWAMQLIALLDVLMAQFQSWPAASVGVALPGWFGVLCAVLATALLVQPVASRWRGLVPFFLLPLVFVQAPLVPGQLRMTVFDVGQGLAVLVEVGTGKERTPYRLLYDAGPAYGESDAGQRVLLPALRQLGVRHLDHLLLSHDDLDHTGGAGSVLAALPVAAGLGTSPRALGLPPWQACRAGQAWQAGGWHFRLLYPDVGAEARFARDNDRSCVLHIRRAGQAVLLPGDLEAASEQWLLVQTGADALRAQVLVLGHHGSRQASSAAWLEAVAPAVAVASAGYRNRYGHPAQAVRARLAAQGTRLVETAQCGALTVDMLPTGQLETRCWRQQSRRYWRAREKP